MITRTRLLDEIADSGCKRWILESGAGFGKSVLLRQLAKALGHDLVVVGGPVGDESLAAFATVIADSCRRLGLGELAVTIRAAVSTNEDLVGVLAGHEVSLAVDDVHAWGPEVGEFLHRFLAYADTSTMVVLSGRSLPASLSRLRDDAAVTLLRPAELAFTLTECAGELAAAGIADADLAAGLHDLTSGWPLAVGTAAARMNRSGDPRGALMELARHDSLVDGLLSSFLNDLDEPDLETARALCVLPFFDAEAAETVGTRNVLDRIAAAGVPIAHRLDGWSEFGEQFRKTLTRSGAADPDSAEQLVRHLVQRDQINAAITACLTTGNHELAATVIASLSSAQETRLEPDQLNAAITTIGDAVESAPRCLYVQAHVNAAHGQSAQGHKVIDRAAKLFARIDPELSDPAHIEVLATQGTFNVFAGRFDEARAVVSRCESYIQAHTEPYLEARVLDLKGVLAHADGSTAALEEATVHMTSALAIWRKLEQPRDAAITTFRLASGILKARSRPNEALLILDALPSVGPMTMRDSAWRDIQRAMLLPYLGRASEVDEALVGPRRAAQVLGFDWMTGWALVAEIVAASFMNDAETVKSVAAEFEAKRYIIFNELSTTLLWLDGIEALARCGHEAQARSALEASEQVAGVDPTVREYFAASLDARFGEPGQALDRLDDLAARPDLEGDKRWRVELLRAHASWRAGDHDQAGKSLDEAYARAADLNQPALPTHVESSIINLINGQEETPAAPRETVDVSIFGAFTVMRGTTQLHVTPGNATTLVKLLAIGRGRLLIDQVIDPLWPDIDLDVGRRRLRNVVKRVRESCGDVLVRSGDSIAFAEGVTSDYDRAVEDAEAALITRIPETVQAAITNLDEPLLVDDRYEEWAEDARHEHRHILLRLFDLQASLAEHSDDIETSVAALERAHDLDPSSGQRLRLAADLLTRAGRTAAAAAVLARREQSR